MPVVKVEPTGDHPIPYDMSDDTVETFLEEVQVAGDTAELLVELGAPLVTSEGEVSRTKELLEEVIRKRKKEPLQQINTAFASAAFLRTYGSALAFDVVEARTAITSKLMEIANCGETKYELKALELLGKHSDIGLFTERSEVTINYKNPEELENSILTRVKRLLSADVVDVAPLSASLDEELGYEPKKLADMLDAEYVEVEEVPEKEQEGE